MEQPWSQLLHSGYVIMTALSVAVLTLHSLFLPHRRVWINVVNFFLYAHLAIVDLLGLHFLNPTSRSSEKSWMTLYLIAFFVPSVYLVLYVASQCPALYTVDCSQCQDTSHIYLFHEKNGTITVQASTHELNTELMM